MTTLLILITISIIFFAIAFKAKNDKTQHVFAGYVIAFLSGSLLFYFIQNLGVGEACILGSAIATFFGAVKEIVYDKWMGKGVCSIWDFLATMFGGISGGIVLRIVYAVIGGEGV